MLEPSLEVFGAGEPLCVCARTHMHACMLLMHVYLRVYAYWVFSACVYVTHFLGLCQGM